MSDQDEPRPAPKYGQYATPDEQRARMGVPAEGAPDRTSAAAAPPVPLIDRESGTAGPERMSMWRLIDRAGSVALLVVGLFNVFGAFETLTNPTTTLAAIGMTVELSDPQAARAWGIVACVLLILGWIVTAWLTWWMLKRRRIAFWVPLSAGVVFNLIAAVLVVIGLMGDPAVFRSLGGG